MFALSFPGVPSRRRAAARWATAALAVGLLAGCSSSTGGGSAPSGSGAAAASSSATGDGAATAAAPSPVRDAAGSSQAGAALAGLKVAAPGAMSGYARDAQFGDWIDADGDCQDTRQEVLARDLDQVVSADGCKVDSGVLDDPYTATTIDFTRGVATSAQVQVDHVVAAGNAWVSGAQDLSWARRVEFYNDPLNLLAVDGPTNGDKSDSPAHEWLPPNPAFRCQYVATQITVKAKYELWVTASEQAAMAGVLTGCPGQALPTGEPFGDPTPSGTGGGAGPAPTRQAPAPVPGAPAGGFADCPAAKAAGAAPLHRGEPGYRSELDRDGDGVACET